MAEPRVWIIGYGDIGQRIAAQYRAQGVDIGVVTRRQQVPREGLVSLSLDLDTQPAPAELAGDLIYTVPPPRGGTIDGRLRRWLTPFPAGIRSVCYLSTSGVYGNCDGHWVDETRSLAPLTDRAWRRADAETRLQAAAQQQGFRLAILRVPGIYGPGRWPIERLRRGTPVVEPSEAPWSNRIHSDDLATACRLASAHGRGVYNLSDGTPSKMSDYFLAVAAALGLPAPPLISWAQAQREYSEEMLSFLRESRRLDIGKARRELNFNPVYPDLAAGIAASADEFRG